MFFDAPAVPHMRVSFDRRGTSATHARSGIALCFGASVMREMTFLICLQSRGSPASFLGNAPTRHGRGELMNEGWHTGCSSLVTKFPIAFRTMADWHFFQGVRGEWRWYRLDPQGFVTAEAETGFADMPSCMANARRAGFRGHAFAVHARSALARWPRRRREASNVARERRVTARLATQG